MGFKKYYPIADKTSQNFVKRYPGKEIIPHVLVLHTMEVNGFPGYQNGGVAPHLSLKLMMDGKGNLLSYSWRQHFPFNRTARAVRNNSGGVETNNSAQGVIQVELGGTCGWAANVKPNWSDREQLVKIAAPLIDFLVFAKNELGIQLIAPYDFYKWNSKGHRMSYKEWLNFKGICGHQHVPENVHVDPGLIDIDWLISEAKKKIDGNTTPPVVPPVIDPVPSSVFVPNQIKLTGKLDKDTIKLLQYVMGMKGASIDGIWGPDTKKQFQKWLFVKQDLVIGPLTVKALQKRVGVPIKSRDGIWGPDTNMFLQDYLNKKVKK